MPVRNEDWVLGLTARAVLQWCDELVVGLHACTDASAKIVADVCFEEPGRITWTEHPDPVWSEMAHRQALLDIARGRGATHIAIVDADEILTANLIPLIRGAIASVPQFSVFQLPWICLAGDPHKYWT